MAKFDRPPALSTAKNRIFWHFRGGCLKRPASLCLLALKYPLQSAQVRRERGPCIASCLRHRDRSLQVYGSDQAVVRSWRELFNVLIVLRLSGNSSPLQSEIMIQVKVRLISTSPDRWPLGPPRLDRQLLRPWLIARRRRCPTSRILPPSASTEAQPEPQASALPVLFECVPAAPTHLSSPRRW